MRMRSLFHGERWGDSGFHFRGVERLRPFHARRRQDEARRRAFVFNAFERDVTVMQAGDLAGDGEAKSDAAVTPRGGGIALLEGLEDPLDVAGRYADAVVLNDESEAVVRQAL